MNRDSEIKSEKARVRWRDGKILTQKYPTPHALTNEYKNVKRNDKAEKDGIKPRNK